MYVEKRLAEEEEFQQKSLKKRNHMASLSNLSVTSVFFYVAFAFALTASDEFNIHFSDVFVFCSSTCGA